MWTTGRGTCDSLHVSPRRDVQLVGGDFVNSADEDADNERDDNEDALLSLNIDEVSDSLGHSSSTALNQLSQRSTNFDEYYPKVQLAMKILLMMVV